MRVPSVPDVLRVRPTGRDDTALIQAALAHWRALPQRTYAGLWFDPRTGETRPLDAPPSWGKGTRINKPTGDDWLLLLTKK